MITTTYHLTKLLLHMGVWWEHLKSTLFANFKSTLHYYSGESPSQTLGLRNILISSLKVCILRNMSELLSAAAAYVLVTLYIRYAVKFFTGITSFHDHKLLPDRCSYYSHFADWEAGVHNVLSHLLQVSWLTSGRTESWTQVCLCLQLVPTRCQRKQRQP